MQQVPSVADFSTERSLGSPLLHILRTMRTKQWIKNVFVVGAIVFAKEHLLVDVSAVGGIIAAFLLLCFVSSAVYLINDLVDIEKDRQHPVKRRRPLASGDLSPVLARGAAAVLLLACFAVVGFQVWRTSPADMGWVWFAVVFATYFLLQLAYIFGLKHVLLLDVFIIAAGFVLRAMAGAVIISVEITGWWILSVFFLALFLALGKRRGELHVLDVSAGNHRPILQEYSKTFLDYLLLVVVACNRDR